MAPRETSGPLSGIAMLTSLFAVAVAAVAVVVVSNVDSGGGTSTATTTAPVEVSLGDFFIDPSPLTVSEGATLAVHNEGNTVHNLAVRDTDMTTSDLQFGERENLDLSGLASGTYEAYCTIGGHLEAGMTTTLTVTGGTSEVDTADAGDHGGHGDGTEEDWARLDAAMEETILAFPAETEGVGNQPLEPTEVTDDGTLVFDLVAEITDWEVEPGKVVKAWSYNGQVPGPWIRVNSGDRLQIRVENKLPLGTDVHWHGIDVPNDMDGVAPVTQTLIPAGGTHTYEFTAQRQSVGMYHAHHHGQLAIPNGLFGAFQIDDLPLPTGRTISGMEIPEDLEVAHELPMVLNDAGVIGLSLNGKSFPATVPLVMQEGEWGLVHYFNEGLQVHPMHLHGFRQLVVARDGIPLDEPFWVDTINVAPGERFSILFQADVPGTWVWHCHILTHAERAEGMFGMVSAVVVQENEA